METTTLKPWSSNHQKKYSWLFNYLKKEYPDIKQENYIDILKNDLKDIIQKNEKWSESSKESLLFMISRYLFNKNDQYYSVFAKSGFEYMKSTRNKEGLNETDDKEKENLKEYEFLLKVYQAEKEKQNVNTTKEQHLQFLLFSLLVLQPPLRCSFYCNVKVIYNLSDNDNKNNFILINNENKIFYIVNNDKVSNIESHKKNNKIEIENIELKELIISSFQLYKRQLLFELNEMQIPYSRLLKWIRDITGVQKINFDMFRSSYITWYYKKNLTLSSRELLSYKMRHSVITAQKYKK
jgi:hypothetical protein